MKITLSKVSLKTLELAITETLKIDSFEVVATGYKVLKNSSYQISYTVSGRKCSRFFSAKIIQQAAIRQRVEASRAVQFPVKLGAMAKTATGHTVTKFGCSCEDFKSAYAPTVDGYKICKHLISYSRDVLGLTSLSQYVTHRNQVINSLFAS